ncbi:hypothetical protein [Daejeonella sp.]|uniref:hypothetical protein n=1 Tax=Daejeonella sp. TaxID=2805397 RepID=UPI0025BA76BC|nr:hypothetical protein [Daejeonella sp.]
MEITNNFKTMKSNVFTKFSVTLVLLFVMTTSFFPNKAKAIDPGTIAEAIEAIIDAVCPETPQNRCKNGTCQSGSCFSFRAACGERGSSC